MNTKKTIRFPLRRYWYNVGSSDNHEEEPLKLYFSCVNFYSRES
jgi:hypothetical protein